MCNQAAHQRINVFLIVCSNLVTDQGRRQRGGGVGGGGGGGGGYCLFAPVCTGVHTVRTVYTCAHTFIFVLFWGFVPKFTPF